MPRPGLCYLVSCFFLALLAGHCPAKEIDTERLSAIAREGLKRWQAPGLAIAVVQDGKVIYLQGFGVRELGAEAPVTPDTIFAFASLTKAFTATALALLVDEGKANWDDPVRKHLDWFRLADPLADREVTLRDLLCHRTGLARHDVLYQRSLGVEEAVRRMAHLEPSSSFRSRYAYNNLAYMAAGLAVGKTAGSTWDAFVQKRLLDPLGMKTAVFTDTAARASKDHATPHHHEPAGKSQPIEWYPDTKQIRGAGSLKGSARDLTAWMRLHLGRGVFEGKRLVSLRSMAEMHTPQIVVPMSTEQSRLFRSTQSSYGLGWHISDSHGLLVLDHGGSNEGFRSSITLVPGRKLGLAVLTNTDDNHFLLAIKNQLLDELLQRPKTDWHAHYEKFATSAARATAEGEKRWLAARKKGTKPALELTGFAGTYSDPAYGPATIEAGEKQLTLLWNGFRIPLEHFQYDTFAAVHDKTMPSDLKRAMLFFEIDSKGQADRLRFLGRTFRRTVKP